MWADANDSVAGGFNKSTAKAPGGDSKAPFRPQAIVPMLIKHITSLTDKLEFFNQTMHFVEVVARVTNPEITSTKVNYVLEDFSGSMGAVLWLDADSAIGPTLMCGCYYQLYGSLRFQENKHILMLLNTTPVEDPNIITTHILLAITARYEIEHASGVAEKSVVRKSTNTTLVNSMVDDIDMNSNGLTPFQNSIYKIVERYTDDVGCNIDDVLKNAKADRQRTQEALDLLVGEGHIYTTIDDRHFKITDN